LLAQKELATRDAFGSRTIMASLRNSSKASPSLILQWHWSNEVRIFSDAASTMCLFRTPNRSAMSIEQLFLCSRSEDGYGSPLTCDFEPVVLPLTKADMVL
jgi:hypothetical protein